jgi:O-antigen ligase
LQITAEYPWFGAGWNQPQPLYEYYYLPANVDEGGAIEMNDYLMLGATIGVPALFCFCMYLCLSFKESVRQESRPTGNQGRFESDWLKAVCRAGALVLLVGFWFDGGLFKLPTAATFWILLELGAAEPSQPHAQTDSPDTKSHEDVS